MPLETFSGSDVTRLLAQARESLGADAVVVSVRRTGAARFTLTAGDAPAVAARAAAAPPRPFVLPDPRSAAAPARRAPPASAPRSWPALGEPERRDGPTVIALVGPTGSGKTTTIAKLANHPDAYGARRVGLLSLDTYRVGAVEQSRIYAELSHLPFVAVHERGEIAGALRRLRGCEIVLVDTAGRGPAAAHDLDETCAALADLAPAEVHVTVPAGLKAEQADRVVSGWKARGATHVLPTKLDECPHDHAAFDAALRHRMRVRWLTDGQEVPADLKPGTLSMMGATRRARAELAEVA